MKIVPMLLDLAPDWIVKGAIKLNDEHVSMLEINVTDPAHDDNEERASLRKYITDDGHFLPPADEDERRRVAGVLRDIADSETEAEHGSSATAARAAQHLADRVEQGGRAKARTKVPPAVRAERASGRAADTSIEMKKRGNATPEEHAAAAKLHLAAAEAHRHAGSEQRRIDIHAARAREHIEAAGPVYIGPKGGHYSDPEHKHSVKKSEAPMLFIGPKGGRWADAAHKRHYVAPVDVGERKKVVDVDRLLEGNLGIARIDMPQIASALVPEFITGLKTKGVTVTNESVPAHKLRATQGELHADKIQREVDTADLAHLSKPLIVSADNFLLDGHHRWAALTTIDPGAQASIVRVHLPIRELLAEAKSFGGASYKKSLGGALDLLKAHNDLWGVDTPRPAQLTGFLDEVGVTPKGRKKRAKEKKLRHRDALDRHMAPEERFAPAKPMPRGDRTAENFTPDAVHDLHEGGRASLTDKMDRVRSEIERKSGANNAVRDAIRAQRGPR